MAVGVGGVADEAGAAKVVEAVRDLVPVLGERAEGAERAGKVPEESVRELADAGLFRLLQPTRFGGLAAHPAHHYTAIKAVARACGSTGWISSVIGVHNWQLALFPEQAQQDVWGADPGTRISSSYAPTGKVEAVDGGFLMSGRWAFSSGCEHADWAFLGGMTFGEDGAVDARTYLVPRTVYRIEPNWDTQGLRATGSHDIVIDEPVFVPEHRSLAYAHALALDCPGHAVNPEPVYKLPFGGLFTTTVTVPLLGVAEGAYQTYIDVTRERFRVSYGQKVVEDPFAHVRIARAASDVDAAWLQIERNVEEMYGHAVRGEELPLELRLRVRRDQVLGTERAVSSTDLMVENAGGNAMRHAHPLQRYWRDVHTGRGHVANDPERALTLFGRGALGLDVHDTMI
ncbi:3-hydroxy-9,10-secoandrosta-1,3,5(10)-triene-9,17-dione monooxygenase oxygenase subunit [Streptomyces iconiensis]|uniref:Acyl-CoA dehydrogenase family protein n=1 Tax=Streptomyces iconiensis TaxID=1384038 RepID=A0ABT7A9W0_9ACTN|nr:3-hydroxy-9,10-secoandrosta-1,3,5(10)-triene-9,17-dione monooxygenase oxygenase subunit [Streptomyces iconiensis]MDJ1138125.1 acyl-CoA dehydrogenase family protein [Streptomyces iconiensis]